MRKEKIKLIKKYFQNYPDFDQQKLLLRKIALETSAVEKKEIFDFCEQEIKKLRFYFLVRIPLMVSLINLCLIFLGIFEFKIILIYGVLLMSLGLYRLLIKDGMGLSMPTIALNFFLGKKIFIYENLLMLKFWALPDDYYDPFGCSECINFHGRSYDGNPLVCAIHPYGLKDCPDFEELRTQEVELKTGLKLK